MENEEQIIQMGKMKQLYEKVWSDKLFYAKLQRV